MGGKIRHFWIGLMWENRTSHFFEGCCRAGAPLPGASFFVGRGERKFWSKKMESVLRRLPCLFEEEAYPTKIAITATTSGAERAVEVWRTDDGVWSAGMPPGIHFSKYKFTPIDVDEMQVLVDDLPNMKAVSSLTFMSDEADECRRLMAVLAEVHTPFLRGLEVQYTGWTPTALFGSTLAFLQRVPEIYRFKVNNNLKLPDKFHARMAMVLLHRGDFKTFVHTDGSTNTTCLYLQNRNRHNHVQRNVTLLNLLLRESGVPQPVFFRSRRNWERHIKKASFSE